MIPTGNHFWDKAGLKFTLSPDGALDSAPSWSIDPPDIGVGLTPAEDGLSATLFVDNDVASFTVTAQAPVDNPSTPDLESVSESFTGSFSHSKATSLGGSFEEIVRT